MVEIKVDFPILLSAGVPACLSIERVLKALFLFLIGRGWEKEGNAPLSLWDSNKSWKPVENLC